MHRRTCLLAPAAACAAAIASRFATADDRTDAILPLSVQPLVPPLPQPVSLHVFASSGYLPDSRRIALGLQRLQDAGFEPANTTCLSRRYLRFAGTDAERAADLQSLVQSDAPMPQVLLGARGGYGAMRLLPLVNWAALGQRMQESGSLLVGYSDVCAIQLALLAHSPNSPVCCLAGPMFYSEWAGLAPSAMTMQHFMHVLTHASFQLDIAWAPVRHSAHRIQGTFWGGNLSILAALVGTPFMPRIEGGILFLEDVSEPAYRIERMLQTLYLAGILHKQQAIVFGTFRRPPPQDEYDSDYDFARVLDTFRQSLNIPVLTQFPSGHIRDKVTLPLGSMAQLETTGSGYRITFSAYPHIATAPAE